MKKLFSASLLVASLLSAQAPIEITPMIGYQNLDNDLYLKNHALLGGEVQYNGFNSVIKPEVSLFFSQPETKSPVSNQYETIEMALNGVYEFNKVAFFTPLAKLGLGLSTTSAAYKRENNAFLNAVIGAKIPLTKRVAFKVESRYQPTYNSAQDSLDFYHNFSVLTGLNIAFGKLDNSTKEVNLDLDDDGIIDTRDKCLFTPKNALVDITGCQVVEAVKLVEPVQVVSDFDKDGIIDELDKCQNTPLYSEVDTSGCRIFRDSDNDGIENSVDNCANTPVGVEVNSNGCQIIDARKSIESLIIRFGYKYTELTSISQDNIDTLVTLLEKYPDTKIKLLGYTDNIASKKYNLKLSKKRADKVKSILVKRNINKNRIVTVGMGEANPIATNMYKRGRSQNRRIEIQLIK